MMSVNKIEELITYFKSKGYKIDIIKDNTLEISRGESGFYLQILVEDEITVLNFSVKSNVFSVEFDNYNAKVKLFAIFSTNLEINIEYQHPFIFLHLDMEEFQVMPVTSLVTSLLVQMPVAGELINDIRKITKDLDEKLKET
jgi:hypothetical protein